MIRNQSLYPAELRGRSKLQRGKADFGGEGKDCLAERSGNARHSAARSRHNLGHSAVHFVGFRSDEYLSAVRVWGKPDFIHMGWDRRARRDIDFDRDTIVFAKGAHDQPFASRNFDDLATPSPETVTNRGGGR